MNHSNKSERLTPLDLLMPRTYVGAVFTFRTTKSLKKATESLQTALDKLCAQLPWLTGDVVPLHKDAEMSEGGTFASGLEIQWKTDASSPRVIDKGTIEGSYDALALLEMPPSSIPAAVWPVPGFIDDVQFAAGAPVLAASIFQFNDQQGLGLCLCLHHKVVDAAGFTEVLRSLTQNMGAEQTSLPLCSMGRSDRLRNALHSAPLVSSWKLADHLASHSEFSRMPPSVPPSPAACTTKMFRISLDKVDALKLRLARSSPTVEAPSTNTIVCAMLWSSITRARSKRFAGIPHQDTQLVMAVNGRQRINPTFSPADNPYYGNVVMYSLAKLGFKELSENPDSNMLNKICDSIAQSQSPSLIDERYVAEVHDLVSRLVDYRTLYPGWDLFNSRDLTITSWANLGLHALNFGTGLGTPDFIRMRHVDADGVCIVMPKKQGAGKMLEVSVMLRSDDMSFLEADQNWREFSMCLGWSSEKA